MFDPDKDGIYARFGASTLRRIFACGVLYGLGTLILYTAFMRPPAVFWLMGLIAFGLATLFLAERLRRATQLEIILTETELRDTSGRVLTLIDDVVSVDRGVFAFKPSNGFTLVLRDRAQRAWVPGMWWRMGRRVGVGGTTPAGPAKFMAERIALQIVERDAG